MGTLQVLPLDIRKSIYRYAGVQRFCPIDVPGERARLHRRRRLFAIKSEISIRRWECPFEAKRNSGVFHPFGCGCDPVPTSLLYLCHEVHDEVVQLLYGENAFLLQISFPFGISVDNLRRMSSLQIQVHNELVTSDLQRDYEEGLWRTLCDNLENGNAQRQLTIVSECLSKETASRLLAPLAKLRAAKCSIRLNSSPNATLRSLAETAASHITGQIKAFPLFPKLPKEIQEQIILQAIVAKGEIEFDRPDFNDSTRRQVGVQYISDCCLQCTDILDWCTCPLRHAAYTTNDCQCWRYPIDLFLVNKEIKEVAERLFYANTTLRFWDACPDGDRADYLQRVNHALSKLQNPRQLSFSFRSFQSTDCLPENQTEYDAWVELGRAVKSFETDRTTLVLYLTPMIPEFGMYPRDPDSQRKIWLTHQNIVKQFEGAKFKDFFVFLSFPMWYDLEDDKTRWKRERLLERRVMGMDYIPGSKKYRYCRTNEEKGPRNFWFQHKEISKEQAEHLDLDDPETQQNILNGSLDGFLEEINMESLRRRGIDPSVRDEYDAPET